MAPNTSPDSPSPFTGLFLDVMQRVKTPRQTAREAEYLENLFELPKSAQLLDAPCGNGRIALELASRGYTFTGVDTATPWLDHARADTADRDLTAQFTAHERDMRDLPWTAEFDGAYCLWESFGYFDDDGNRGFLAALARTLKPGARLMLDTHVLESLLPSRTRRQWVELDDGLLVLEENDYDHEMGAITRRWQVRDGAQIERSALTIRIYSYRQLVTLLESSGFTGCTGYAWMSIVPFLPGANRLVMVATRA